MNNIPATANILIRSQSCYFSGIDYSRKQCNTILYKCVKHNCTLPMRYQHHCLNPDHQRIIQQYLLLYFWFPCFAKSMLSLQNTWWECLWHSHRRRTSDSNHLTSWFAGSEIFLHFVLQPELNHYHFSMQSQNGWNC